jgi:hypothetical protein
MSDPNKHYVVVDTKQVEEYLLRGYARSSDELRAHLPSFIDDPGALGLVLMETGKGEFEAANSPPVRYMVDIDHFLYIRSAWVSKLDVLAADDESLTATYVGKGDAATRVDNDDMFETPLGAVAASAPRLRASIAAHREAADHLEAYLKSYGL